MQPSILSDQIRQGLENYLRTTFQITTPHFKDILEEFLLHKKEQLIKGPYLSFKLPFIKTDLAEDTFQNIKFPYQKAFLHQKKAFSRLAKDDPQPTIVATGTGSGKTEAFLFPVLDYCADHINERGIKAIFIYPMNALANDQAERIAKAIYANESTRGNIRAGLYIGKGRYRSSFEIKAMKEDRVINSHHILRDDPPDILLTNYKMLDYLLIRPDDAEIWQHNDGNTLRYLVVDELHTFDGAQGTDLACLLRRLKARLGVKRNYICPIGTSATLGGSENFDDLKKYAEDIFDTNFPEGSVISEHRITVNQYFKDLQTDNNFIPNPQIEEINPDNFSTVEEYLKKQLEVWTKEEFYQRDNWRIELGGWIRKHILFKQILEITKEKHILTKKLLQELSRLYEEFNQDNQRKYELLLNSFLSLIKQAHIREEENIKPLIDINQQLWLREMRRMVASVDKNPKLRYSNDLTEDELKKYLPMVVCRDCGHTGWGATYNESEQKLNHDLKTIYRAFFGNHPNLVFIFPAKQEENISEPTHKKVCANCLQLNRLNSTKCSSCLGENFITIHKYQKIKEMSNYNEVVKDCPRCGSHNSLTIVGARSATLSAVSVSQFFASPFSGNIDNKKLLAFSDSVQDASHRSGFFTGRTYRFNFRGALQQFLNNNDWKGNLAELPQEFISYYKDKFDSKEIFVAQFIPPDMHWLHGYEQLISNDQIATDSDIFDLVKKRISWEIYKEYGHRSLIGRTLEKSSSSLVRFDPNILQKAVQGITNKLREEFGILRELSEEYIYVLLLGVIYNLRTKGGIYHRFLEKYIRSWGNPNVIWNVIYMPRWSKQSRTPSFLTNKNRVDRFQKLLSNKRATWHESWAKKVLIQDFPGVANFIRDIFDIIIRELENKKVFRTHQIKNNKIWSIPAQSLQISTEIEHYQCDVCAHRIQSTRAEKEFWQGAPCLQHNCSGKYQSFNRKDNYYHNLYANGHIKRIRAEEHTGLLDRDKKETIESQFKSQQHTWYPNLLSATPTLEMGIDIGDLNSVFLCSVPPDQSNYVQRIGRAGRKSGAAFNLAVAEAKPHDLYFFSDPLNMIDGEIKTPGCFLNAVAVLIRQFFAFALDGYIKKYGKDSNINRKLGQVLNAYETDQNERFPLKFIDYFKEYKKELYNSFIEIFADRITDETRQSLWNHIEGSEEQSTYLLGRFKSMLHYQEDELQDLKSQRLKITREIKNRERNPVKPADHEKIIKNLKLEAAALGSFIKALNHKNIFQTLTDEGFIPNYTFPESGIKLKSIIYKKMKNGTPREYEYVRPASAGIREFAPDNTFYVDGRKVKIDQVNLNLSNKENWRFCPSCHHTKRIPETGEDELEARCPECGDPQWGDTNQVHEVLELKQVTATTSNRDSLSWDENEVRDPKFYEKSILVQIDYNSSNINSAFKIETDRVPFGFEFIDKVRMIDINFGEMQNKGEKRRIAGEEISAAGFNVCEKCGRVENSDGKIKHTYSCPNKGEEENVKNCYYLYRELESEALRILLPSASFEVNSSEHHSFNAALYLGLKEYFQGNIDHLKTTYMQESSLEGGSIRHYLVLYDTVPGGTGYLKQLMEDENNLSSVFHKALKKLRTCKCRTENKPGCYECIYAYRYSYKMASISSPLAIEILTNILKKWDTIQAVENIKLVSLNKHIQSQLEEKFVKTLSHTDINEKRSYLVKDLVHGKDGWRWHWGDEIYRIEPQVELRKYSNINSIADFVIWSFKIDEEKKEFFKPVAIYTDGFKYHKQKIAEDFEIRDEIMNNSDFLLWNITWNDLDEDNNEGKGIFPINQNEYIKLIKANVGSPEVVHRLIKLKDLWMKGNGLKSLINYLENPNPSFWNLYSHFISLSLEGNKGLVDKESFETTMNNILEQVNSSPTLWQDGFEEKNGSYFQKGALKKDANMSSQIGYLFTIPKHNLKSSEKIFTKSVVLLKIWDEGSHLEDNFRKIWESLLHHVNFLQFINKIYVISTQGIINNRYPEWSMLIVAEKTREKMAEAMSFDIELLDESLTPIISELTKDVLEKSIVGYELVNEQGKVLAEAEMAWKDTKVAILGEWQLAYSKEFTRRDWKVFTIHQALSDINKVKNILVGRG